MIQVRSVLILIAIFCLLIPPVLGGEPPTGVVCGSGTGTQGSTTRIPIGISGVIEPIGTLDLTIHHNAALVSAVEVLPGDFNISLESAIDREQVRIRVQVKEGILGNGTLAWIRYQILAASGSSPLSLLHVSGTGGDGRALHLPRTDGSLPILPGISFTRSADTMRVTVSPEAPKDTVRIEGDNITLTRDGITFTIVTEGLGVSATRSTGLIRQVIAKSPVASINLSSGLVHTWYQVTLPTYLSESSLSLDLSDSIPLEGRSLTQAAAERSRLTGTTCHLLATPTLYGLPESAPLTQYFLLPASLGNHSTNETLWVAVLSQPGPAELIKLDSPSEQGEDGTLTYHITPRAQPASFILFTAQESPRLPSGTGTPSSPGMILSPGAEAASSGLWTAMILIFLLVGIVVVSVFYIHRKRGG